MDAAEIKQEILWIEKLLADPDSVEHKIYLSDAPRKDLITRWAANLEKLHDAGEFHQDINTISTYIGNKFRAWKMDSAVHYVHEVLDYKYKNPIKSENARVGEPRENSSEEAESLLSFEAKQSNQTLIQFLTNTVEALKNNIARLKSDIFLESKIPEIEQEELYLNWAHILKRHQEAWDGREKVLSTTQHIAAYALCNYSLNHAYTKYIKYAKEDTVLTEKQAAKIIRIQTHKVDKLFTPKNFMEAKELGFYGQQCEKCGSWRTEAKYNPALPGYQIKLFCYDLHKREAGYPPKDQWSDIKTLKMEEVIIEH